MGDVKAELSSAIGSMWVSVLAAEKLLEAAAFSPARVRTDCLCGILLLQTRRSEAFSRAQQQNMQRCYYRVSLLQASLLRKMLWLAQSMDSSCCSARHLCSSSQGACVLCLSIRFAMMCALYHSRNFDAISIRMIGIWVCRLLD